MFKKLFNIFRRKRKDEFIGEKISKQKIKEEPKEEIEPKAIIITVKLSDMPNDIQSKYRCIMRAKKHHIIAYRTKSGRIRKKSIKRMLDILEGERWVD